MRIIQLSTTVSYGDAVSNDIFALQKLLETSGYNSSIFAENIDKRILNKGVKYISEMPKLCKTDILIYHLSIATELNYKIGSFACKKLLIYHNITPPDFFAQYNEKAYGNCYRGLKQAEYLSDKVDYCLADSEFNKRDLQKMGYSCKIDVLPILIPFEDYEKEANEDIIKQYSDGKKNIIFTGRIAPNKKIENVIRGFCYYKKYKNSAAHLLLVGGYDKKDLYYLRLQDYIKAIEVKDVYFTGHIPFRDILAYYKVADIFLCMSEHEGFCVPLIEAMFFKVPIVAYNTTAIPYTLGGSGLILEENHPEIVCEAIDRVIKDHEFKEMLIEKQNNRLDDFSYEKVGEQFLKYFETFIGGNS